MSERDLAEEFVDRRLEHEDQRRAVGVGCDVDVPAGGLDHDRVAVARRRSDTADEVGELVGADRAGGRSAQHRECERSLDRFVEQPLELLGRRLGAGEIVGEEVVVELDHVLDEVLVFHAFGFDELVGHLDRLGVAGVVHERVVCQQVGDAVEARLRADWQLGRIGVRTEHLADLGERPVERRPLAVEFVDEHQARDAEFGCAAPQHDVLRLHAGHSVDHEHGQIGDAEAEDRLAAEVRVAGRVDQVDAMAVPIERGDRQRDRLLPRPFLGIVIHHGRSSLDRARPGDHPCPEEQRLGKGRLATPVVPDEHDVSDLVRRAHVLPFRRCTVFTGVASTRNGPRTRVCVHQRDLRRLRCSAINRACAGSLPSRCR